MSRFLLALIIFAGFSLNSLTAQVYGLELSDKAAKKYKSKMVNAPDGLLLFVEMKEGPSQDSAGVFQLDARARYEFWLADQKKPSKLAYKMKKGERVTASKKLVLALSGADIIKIKPIMPTESFASLADEYQRRLEVIAEMERERDIEEKGSKEWIEAHLLRLRKITALQRWLQSCGYQIASEKLSKDVAKESKKATDDAFDARLERALESIHEVPTPEELIESSDLITDSKTTFTVIESQHFRVVFSQTHAKRRIHQALELAEIALEAFRNDHVDPYLSDEFGDLIPDHIFEEFFFGPESAPIGQAFFEGYYGLTWRGDSGSSESKGRTVWRGPTLPQLEFWRTDKKSPLEGVIIHRLGHALARWHYDCGASNISHDWLAEALGYEMSFQHLGRNDVFCIAVNNPDRAYGRKSEKRRGNKPSGGLGFREHLQELAKENPQPFSKLFVLDLYDLSDADIAKGWALWDWTMRVHGLAGEQWIRGFGKVARMGRDGFIPKLRPSLEGLLDFSQGDAFRELQSRWEASLK